MELSMGMEDCVNLNLSGLGCKVSLRVLSSL